MNKLDIGQICFFFVYLICRSNTNRHTVQNMGDQDTEFGFDYSISWVFANSALSCIAFIKMLSYLRMSKEFAGLVYMLNQVTRQLLPLIVFLMGIVCQMTYLYFIAGVTIDEKEVVKGGNTE